MGECCSRSKVELNSAELTPEKLKRLGEGDEESFRSEVDQIWLDYDVSKTGKLNKTEAFSFLRDLVSGVTGKEPDVYELE